MRQFQEPHLCTDCNIDGTAFPEIIEWATAANKVIAPLEFPNALHYLMKDRRMTVERLEEACMICELRSVF